MPIRKLSNALKPSGDTIDITLSTARSLLNVGGDLLSLAPIPGLEVAATALANVIGTIQVMRKNTEDMRNVANRVNELAACLKAVCEQAIQRAEELNLSVANIKPSTPLEDRIERLIARLNDIAEKAKKMTSRSRLSRLVRSKKDVEELSDLEQELSRATQDFKLEGDIAVEGLVNGMFDRLGIIQEGVIAMQKVQLDDHDRGILERLPHARAANYRSGIHESKSGYLPGTREALLKEIDEWAKGTSSTLHHRIYVLSGAAGTGKSTIACEVAKRFERDGILGASFFFVRGSEQLATTRFVFTTIAHQLASYQPATTRDIIDATRSYLAKSSDPQRMEYGLDELIIEPLLKLPMGRPPIILVIDALDECTDSAQELIPKMLYLLAARVSTIPFPLRVFITSRPDYHIENALDSVDFRKDRNLFKLQDVPRTTVGQDVEKYLRDRLSKMPQGEELLIERPNAIAELAKKADGLFIFASTAINFLNEDPDYAVQRLDILHTDNVHNAQQDLSYLDQLYTLVLQNAFGQNIIRDAERMRKVRLVLAAIALLQDQLTVNAMASLIGLSVVDVKSVVRRLASVVLRDADDTVRPLHASFPQFLIDSRRCVDTMFYIDPATYHAHLAISCLSVLTQHDSLRRNVCRLPNPAKMKIDVNDLPSLVLQNVPTHVQYACIHWAFHVSSAPAAASETRMRILDYLDSFLTKQLLVWYEALSLMNQLEVAPAALLMIRSWYQRSKNTPSNVGPLLDDGYRFVLEYFDAINACPEHIYISALPTMPSCKLFDIYSASSVQYIGLKMITPRDSSWSPCIRVIEGISAAVTALAYSPNGRWIVAGTSLGTVCSWDAGSGIPLNTMADNATVRHRNAVSFVDVSPDNSRILSYARDIRIWNLASGALLHVIPLDNNTRLRAVSFSSDGNMILAIADGARSISSWDSCTFAKLPESSNTVSYYPHSTSSFWGASMVLSEESETISIYDLEHRDVRSSLSGHSEHVNRALFFPGEDSKVVSFDSSQVKVWDVPSAQCLQTLNASRTLLALAVSPGGHRIAASSRGMIDIWDAGTGEHLAMLPDDAEAAFCLCFSPKGDRLLSGGMDGIRVWDLSNTNAIGLSSSRPYRSEIQGPNVHQVIFSNDGELAASAAQDSTLTIWRIRSGTPISTITYNQSDNVEHMVFSPNGRHVAAIWDDETLVVYDAESDQSDQAVVTMKLARHPAYMQYSSSGSWLVIYIRPPRGQNYHLDLYAASGLALVTSVDLKQFSVSRGKYENTIKALAFSPDDNNMYVETMDGSSFLWDCHSGESLPTAELDWIKQRGSHPTSREFRLDNGWVVDGTGQKMCWITTSKRPFLQKMAFAYYGHTVVIGARTGKVSIIDMSGVEPES